MASAASPIPETANRINQSARLLLSPVPGVPGSAGVGSGGCGEGGVVGVTGGVVGLDGVVVFFS